MAMTSLVGDVELRINFAGGKTLNVQSSSQPSDPLQYSKKYAFTFGTGALKVNSLYHRVHSIAKGATLSLDLAGALLDAFGDVFTVGIVKVLAVVNLSDVSTVPTDAVVEVGGNAAGLVTLFNAVDNAIKVQAGEAKLLVCTPTAAGYVITPTTYDLLEIVNLDADDAAEVLVIIAGELTV